MSDHLSASELSDLVGCKPNQRSAMVRWLDDNRWHYVTDRTGLPKVARAFYERKMGINEEHTKQKPNYADTPNRQAFA
jgi:hypothetical protein